MYVYSQVYSFVVYGVYTLEKVASAWTLKPERGEEKVRLWPLPSPLLGLESVWGGADPLWAGRTLDPINASCTVLFWFPVLPSTPTPWYLTPWGTSSYGVLDVVMALSTWTPL